jgi:hypothetical protein
MPLPDNPLYFDFNQKQGGKWSNSLGKFEVVKRAAIVKSAAREYRDCIQIRHQPKGGNLLFTFAPGVGFVQFGEGNLAFILDESESRLSPGAAESPTPAPPAAAPARPTRLLAGSIRPLIGLTPNRLATEPNSPEVMVKRFNQTVEMGVSFIVGNSTWTELEPSAENYRLGNLNYLISSAASSRLPISLTLRVIDTIHKNVPPDLKNLSWTHPKMQARVLKLIDTIAPALKGQVSWFMFGYEIDAYIREHPSEANEFSALHRIAAERIKKLVPGLQVGCTLSFTGIGELEDRLAALNLQLDFVALTYCPTRGDFTVEDPTVLPRDFDRMKQVAAGRKIVLQEIAYPSSPACGSSEQKQTQFYRLAVAQLEQDERAFECVNFMMLADLSDSDADNYAGFYGMRGSSKFRALLQTLGMHDVRGNPKPSWEIFRQYLQKANQRQRSRR